MLDLYEIRKTYTSKHSSVEALKGVSLHVDKTDIFGIIGHSGAGKSTLIRCINLLERPDNGRVIINGTDITALPGGELRKIRQKIGMIFQHFNLLKSSTVYQNVALPITYMHLGKKAVKEKVEGLLELVGLSDKAQSYPSQLSGGQKQRVAIARALANDPQMLLSDEAMSALDPQATDSILSLLGDLNKKLGLTIVLITHEMRVIKEICNKVAVLDQGVLVEQGATVEVFSNPQHSATSKFVANLFQTEKINKLIIDTNISNILQPGGLIAQLLFTGESANDAYISYISRRFDIDVRIVYGNIEIIQSQPIGSLFVIFNGDRDKIIAAVQYLVKENVRISVIKDNKILCRKEAI